MEDRWRRSYPHPALSRSYYNIQLNLYKICDTFTEDD